jgi:AcrR family transcriptional regulator
MTKRRPPPAPRRPRRTAEEARAAILDAAERLLIETGPSAIRLQQVAEQVGVAHPTVLHHFGSREALVQAVVERALSALQDDVIAAIEEAPESDEEVAALLDRVFTALATHGHGRALAWCALSGMASLPDALRLRQVAELVHAIRSQRRGKRHTPPFEDTLFTVVLAMSSLFAQSVLWPAMQGEAAGILAPERFRRWLGRLLVTHLKEGGSAA